MRFGVIFFSIAFICLFFNISAFGQEGDREPSKKDTIREEIVYEYDTVYIAPDTLKLTDTIVHYKLKEASIESTKKSGFLQKSVDFLDNLNFLKSFSDRWSLGVGVHVFITGIYKSNYEVDSFSQNRTINSALEFHINYRTNQFKYSFGVGYLRNHEQFQYQGNRFLKGSVSTNGSYDSLLIRSNGITNNYYQYLLLFLNVGKKWGTRKVFFVLNGTISGSILLKASALFPANPLWEINSSFVQKINYQVGLNPCIGFMIRKQFEFSLGPFCNYSILNKGSYPANNHVFIGISCRIQ